LGGKGKGIEMEAGTIWILIKYAAIFLAGVYANPFIPKVLKGWIKVKG